MFSNCVTWLSQLIVVTDFKQRPDNLWQTGDSSFLFLARLQAIAVVSHAEPTICRSYFCPHHHLTEHQKAIRDRQSWQFAYFFRQVRSKACVSVYIRSEFVFLYWGSLFIGEIRKGWLHLVLSYDSHRPESTLMRKLVCTCTIRFVAWIFHLRVVSTEQVVASSYPSITLVERTWIHWQADPGSSLALVVMFHMGSINSWNCSCLASQFLCFSLTL